MLAALSLVSMPRAAINSRSNCAVCLFIITRAL